jgi:hypothetical protein
MGNANPIPGIKDKGGRRLGIVRRRFFTLGYFGMGPSLSLMWVHSYSGVASIGISGRNASEYAIGKACLTVFSGIDSILAMQTG